MWGYYGYIHAMVCMFNPYAHLASVARATLFWWPPSALWRHRLLLSSLPSLSSPPWRPICRLSLWTWPSHTPWSFGLLSGPIKRQDIQLYLRSKGVQASERTRRSLCAMDGMQSSAACTWSPGLELLLGEQSPSIFLFSFSFPRTPIYLHTTFSRADSWTCSPSSSYFSLSF